MLQRLDSLRLLLHEQGFHGDGMPEFETKLLCTLRDVAGCADAANNQAADCVRQLQPTHAHEVVERLRMLLRTHEEVHAFRDKQDQFCEDIRLHKQRNQ